MTPLPRARRAFSVFSVLLGLAILVAPGVTLAKTVLCVGDSITRGYGNRLPYPTRLQFLLGGGANVINEGMLGEFSFEGEERLPSLLARYSPTHVLILYGTNDSTFFLPASETARTIGAMADRVRASGAIPIVGTLLPQTGPRSDRMPVIRAVNELYRWNRAQYGYLLADLARAFDPPTGLMQGDDLHPNESGAQIMAESFRDLLFMADQQGTEPRWSDRLDTWLYPEDRGWHWSYDYLGVVEDVGGGFALSTLLGWVYVANGNDWLWSTRVGWMRVEQNNGMSYIRSSDWATWLQVLFGETLFSFDYGALTVVDGLDVYNSDLFGRSIMGSYGGWMLTDRFGWIWADRNQPMSWFFSQSDGWLRIDPNGSGYIWSDRLRRWLPPS